MISIYTDGSFNGKNYSWAFVVVNDNNTILFENSGRGKNKEACSMYQIQGEIEAVMNAVAWCLDNNIKEVSLFYDLIHLRHWALGEWKRNNIFTQRYYDFMQKVFTVLKVDWVKVKGHSGDYWNEYVDTLAQKTNKR